MNAMEPAPPEFEVFYDGGCPLCLREIAMIRRWDRQQRLKFTDIDDPAFDAQAVGKTHDELMAEIHGRLPDGTLVKGVEVFRRLYGAVGFRWLTAMTRWPVIAPLLDLGYYVFARNRLWLTGRRCQAGVCRAPHVKQPADETPVGS